MRHGLLIGAMLLVFLGQLVGCGGKKGCTDPVAVNYDPEATVENNSCVYPDPCSSISCQAGQCVEGICECDSTHYGDRCQNAFVDLYAGTYQSNESCVGGNHTYGSTITVAGQDLIAISGLYDQAYTITAEIDSISFSIPTQSFGADQISGSGNLDTTQHQITLSFVLITGGATEICTAILDRQ